MKVALILSDWVEGHSAKDIEEEYDSLAGTIRAAGETGSWLTDAAASIADLLEFPKAEVEFLQDLSVRLERGVSRPSSYSCKGPQAVCTNHANMTHFFRYTFSPTFSSRSGMETLPSVEAMISAHEAEQKGNQQGADAPGRAFHCSSRPQNFTDHTRRLHRIAGLYHGDLTTARGPTPGERRLTNWS
jgi:hypothetical protein